MSDLSVASTAELNTARRGRRRRMWFFVLLELLLLASIFFGLRLWLDGQAQGVAPPFSAESLSSGPVSLAQYTEDGPVALRFWATWCPNCMREHDMIDRLATEGRVLTIAIQSGDAADVATYLDAESLTMPTVVDDGRLALLYDVVAVPTTVIIDRDGEIRFRVLGLPGEWGLRSRLWLARWM